MVDPTVLEPEDTLFLPVQDKPPKDFLWLHLRDLPFFRALLRAVEARFYQDLDLPAPILDVGCGDGHFATVAFDQPIDVGLDPGGDAIREAALLGGHRFLIQSNGEKIPFPDGYFGSAFSNSVLEHIPNVEAVLLETTRVLQPGAPFVFCVPNHQFLRSLQIGRLLDSAGLSRLGDYYRRFFNRIARHYHSDSPEVWQERLERSGFQLERWWHYYPPQALHVTEWGHFFGLPSLVSRVLTGRWILAPTRWNLALTEKLVRRHYEGQPLHEQGVCTFYVARRR